MASLNRMTLIGNLGADPKVTTLEGGRKLVSFSVATSSAYSDNDGKKHESTEWHDVVAFGKVGEICSKFLKKGSSVFVEGPLHHKDRIVGDITVKQTSINANKVLFLDKRAKGEPEAAQPEGDMPF